MIDFKAGSALSMQLQTDLKGKQYKYVYLETKSAEGRATLQVFMNASKFIVKGML
jgi:hypothetical protein